MLFTVPSPRSNQAQLAEGGDGRGELQKSQCLSLMELDFFSCPDESLRQLYTYPCHSLHTYKQDLLLLDIHSDPRAL